MRRAENNPSTGVRPARSIDNILQVAFREGIQNIARHARLVLEAQDSEALHQMRVNLRRMRAILKTLRPVIARKHTDSAVTTLQSVARQLDGARDVDVFIHEYLPVCQGVNSVLNTRVEALRSEAYARIGRYLQSRAYSQTMNNLACWVEEMGWNSDMSLAEKAQLSRPMADVSSRVLRKQRKRVLAIGRRIEYLDDRGLHKLRIACKNLRYSAEFFCDIYDHESFLRLIECLKGLQDVLGKLHDQVVFSTLLSLLDKAPNTISLPPEASIEVKSPGSEVDRLRVELRHRWESFIVIDLPTPLS